MMYLTQCAVIEHTVSTVITMKKLQSLKSTKSTWDPRILILIVSQYMLLSPPRCTILNIETENLEDGHSMPSNHPGLLLASIQAVHGLW